MTRYLVAAVSLAGLLVGCAASGAPGTTLTGVLSESKTLTLTLGQEGTMAFK